MRYKMRQVLASFSKEIRVYISRFPQPLILIISYLLLRCSFSFAHFLSFSFSEPLCLSHPFMLQKSFSEMQSSPVLSLSPSFNSYSSSRLAEIAARVVDEFRAESNDPHDVDDGGGGGYSYASNPFLTDYEESLLGNGNGFVSEGRRESSVDVNKGNDDEKKDEEEEEEEFEFAVVGKDFISSPAPADEIFYNGQIRPCYPLFNQDLLLEGVEFEKQDLNLNNQRPSEGAPSPTATGGRLSLRKLFIEDRDPPSSCSSSEADELDGVEPASYCVWNPKTAAKDSLPEQAGCKKSNSTGSSKRWKFRDLLHRSHSDGKDSFVFLTHAGHGSKNAKKGEEKVKKIEKSSAVAPEVPKAAGKPATPVAPYAKDDGERRRTSFLPYRRDVVGFLSNVNGLSRNLHPF